MALRIRSGASCRYFGILYSISAIQEIEFIKGKACLAVEHLKKQFKIFGRVALIEKRKKGRKLHFKIRFNKGR